MQLLKILSSVCITVLSAENTAVAAAAVRAPLRSITGPIQAPTISLFPNVNTTSITEARTLGALFPPGYSPSHPYYHPIHHSGLTLRCPTFIYEPRQNHAKIENLLTRLIRFFQSSQGRDEPVFTGQTRTWEWYEPDPALRQPFAGLEVMVPEERPRDLRNGEFAMVLRGMGEIWRGWPKLDFRCDVLRDPEGRGGVGLGWVYLFFEPGE